MNDWPGAEQPHTRVVNLCFHGVGPPGRVLEAGEEDYWLDCAQYEEILDVICRHPDVRITHDDGNDSDVEQVLPRLRQRDLTAAFFLIADRLDTPGSLSAAGARELVDAGMLVGSHGLHHRPWRSLGQAELESELVEAPRLLQSVVGYPVKTGSCPFGSYDRRVLAAARRTGYQHIYTVDRAPASNRDWLQARYTITASDSPAAVERLVTTAGQRSLASTARALRNLTKRLR